MRTIALFTVSLVVALSGCARGGTDARPDGAGGSLDAGPSRADAGRLDGGSVGDASTSTDAATGMDASRDAGSAAADAGPRDAGGSGADLDPALDVPPESNPPCTTPGASCPSIAVCRFYSSTEGRCESCTACGNLFDPCVSGEDCDILFVCYQNQCTNFCTLGTFECGPVEDCIDVGHPTRGACRPGF